MQSKEQGANRLGELMAAHEPPLKRYDIAALCRRDPTTIGRWIKGDAEIPTEALRLLTEQFDCSAEYLLGWDREPETGKAAA